MGSANAIPLLPLIIQSLSHILHGNIHRQKDRTTIKKIRNRQRKRERDSNKRSKTIPGKDKTGLKLQRMQWIK